MFESCSGTNLLFLIVGFVSGVFTMGTYAWFKCKKFKLPWLTK